MHLGMLAIIFWLQLPQTKASPPLIATAQGTSQLTFWRLSSPAAGRVDALCHLRLSARQEARGGHRPRPRGGAPQGAAPLVRLPVAMGNPGESLVTTAAPADPASEAPPVPPRCRGTRPCGGFRRGRGRTSGCAAPSLSVSGTAACNSSTVIWRAGQPERLIDDE